MEPPTVEGYSFDCASITDIVVKAVAQDEAKAEAKARQKSRQIEHNLNMFLVCQHQMESCITKHAYSKVRALPILHRRGDNGASNGGGL